MRRKQVNKIVDAFGFEKHGDKDSYCLDMEDYRIYFYYFQDKPRGWEVEISHKGTGFYFVRRIEKPLDMLMFFGEYSSKQATDVLRSEFRDKLNDLHRNI